MNTRCWDFKGQNSLLSLIFAVGLIVIGGCTKPEVSVNQPVVRSGQVTFSYRDTNHSLGGRVKSQDPAFVSYILKKPDGSTINKKVELYQFNEGYITQPQQLDVGHYELQQFLLLAADNGVIAAAPLAGSGLASLVEHPLPIAFDVTENATSSIVPDVLLVESHTPEAFGYVTFGFEVVSLFSFDTNVTIADNNPHGAIDYTLEIIAKDAPLGNVKWTRTLSMSGGGKVQVPSKHGHYTFKASKIGFIPHVQHFFVSELAPSATLSFEFIPESLSGFLVVEQNNGAIKFYFPNDHFRTRLYARIDLAEGYSVNYMFSDKSASTKGGYPLGQYNYSELFGQTNRVNIFNNVPFALAQNSYSGSDLPFGQTQSMDDVDIGSYTYLDIDSKVNGLPDIGFTGWFQLWKGKHN